MEACEEGKTEVWADFCAERKNRPQIQRKGTRPRMPERRNGLAPGIFNRFFAEGQFTDRAIPNEAQLRKETIGNRGALPVCQTVFGPDPGDI